MTETSSPNALKHGAFSGVLILPGEDPQEFEELKNGLFAEYKPSGASEENLINSIARALWQERRLKLYQHVQHLRAAKSDPYGKSDPDGDDLEEVWAMFGKTKPKESPAPPVPTPIVEKSDDDKLLDLSDLLTLDHLAKELDVEAKLQSKIDRLFKRFFQIKTMKQIAGLGDSKMPSLVGDKPVLELTVANAMKSSEE